jgi:hypothetical protein
VAEKRLVSGPELSVFAKYPVRTNTFLARDDWLLCDWGSLQKVALKESARVQKVKAVSQATVMRLDPSWVLVFRGKTAVGKLRWIIGANIANSLSFKLWFEAYVDGPFSSS